MDKHNNEYDEEYINNITLENFKKNMEVMKVEIYQLTDEAFTKRYNRSALEIIKTKLEELSNLLQSNESKGLTKKGDIIKVKILEVDSKRNRISFWMV